MTLLGPVRRLLALALALVPAAAGAEEGDAAGLRFTVRPSGVEDESLDEKLARRDRFRFICIGCSRASGPIDTQPFEPIRTLNAPHLSRALGAERADATEPQEQPR